MAMLSSLASELRSLPELRCRTPAVPAPSPNAKRTDGVASARCPTPASFLWRRNSYPSPSRAGIGSRTEQSVPGHRSKTLSTSGYEKARRLHRLRAIRSAANLPQVKLYAEEKLKLYYAGTKDIPNCAEVEQGDQSLSWSQHHRSSLQPTSEFQSSPGLKFPQRAFGIGHWGRADDPVPDLVTMHGGGGWGSDSESDTTAGDAEDGHRYFAMRQHNLFAKFSAQDQHGWDSLSLGRI